MMRSILLTALLLIPFIGQAQLVVGQSQTASALVQNVLLGNGVQVSNITFNGQPGNAVFPQIGSFDATNANIEIDSGIILASGGVQVAIGPNNIGSASAAVPANFSDPDLQVLAGTNINDAAVLEFDFIPSGDMISFSFVFGSEEYPEFVGQFNDVFGFFLSGPGITGPFSNNAKNIALIPGTTTPVTINSVNENTNAGYYVSNGTGSTAPNNSSPYYVQFDGFTKPITASSQVMCGEEYHIKIAIADAIDSGYDSGVFLKSFQSNGVMPIVTADLALPCSGPVDLELLSISGGTPPYSYSWTLNGTELGTGTSISVSIAGTYVLTVTDACGGSDQSEVIVSPPQSPLITFDLTPDTTIYCQETVDLMVTNVGGGTPPFTYTWMLDGVAIGNGTSIHVTTADPGTYTILIEDDCQGSQQGQVVVTVPPPPPLVLTVTPDMELPCQGQVPLAVLAVDEGTAPYTYNWTSNGASMGNGASINITNGMQGTYQVNVTDLCGATGSATIVATPPDVDPISVGPIQDVVAICLGEDVILNATPVTGGDSLYHYTWYDPDSTVVGTGATIAAVVHGPTQFTVHVTDECLGSGSGTVNVQAPPPLALYVSPDTMVCEHGPATVAALATGGGGTYSFEWMDNGHDEAIRTVHPPTDTLLTVKVTDNCGHSLLGEVWVFVQLPDVEAWPGAVDADRFELAAECTVGGSSFFWEYSSGGVGFGPVVHHTFGYTAPGNEQEYWAMVTATTPLGCVAMDTIYMTPAAQFYFPNAFTPNGDGLNDLFGPSDFKLDHFAMTIYDRWGKELYHTISLTELWDGHFSNGEPVPTGVYIYSYVVEGERLPRQEGKGIVTVLR